MAHTTRELYLAIANSAEPEPREGWSEDYPVDLPDHRTGHDWPDAPLPQVNDIITTHMARGWLAICIAIITGSLTYLATQVQW